MVERAIRALNFLAPDSKFVAFPTRTNVNIDCPIDLVRILILPRDTEFISPVAYSCIQRIHGTTTST